MRLITTSWDDGHPLDFRIAELLSKYGLQGTFYVPQHNGSQQMMNETQIQQLSTKYEIGSHTLNHVWLNDSHRNQWEAEIKGSYEWVKNITGDSPVSFCFPGGVYNSSSLAAVFQNGYQLVRTTELLSTATPFANHILPTSLQVYEHSNFTYTRHLVKRAKWKRLAAKLLLTPATSLLKLTDHYLDTIQQEGGCFHLWGHSWEIEKFGLWKKLEDIFKVLSQRKDFLFLQNRQLL